jgi:hypothetical protein
MKQIPLSTCIACCPVGSTLLDAFTLTSDNFAFDSFEIKSKLKIGAGLVFATTFFRQTFCGESG